MLNIRTLLFEDVNRSKKILKDLNIPESDSRYQKLKKLLEKNIGYLGLFTNFMFVNRIEYDELVQFYNEILAEPAKFKKLPKPLVQYNSFLEVQNALVEIEKEIKYQKVYKMLPKNVRELIDKNLDKDSKDKLILLSDDFLKAYGLLSKTDNKSSEQIGNDKKELDDFYAGFAIITGNNGDISDVINKIELLTKKYVLKLNFQKKVEEIRATNGAEVISANPETKIIVGAIFNYEASKKLGSPNWCISYSRSHFNDYTTNRAQFFIWNYNFDVSNKDNLLGLTLNSDFTPYEFQDSLNAPIVQKNYNSMMTYLNSINAPVEVMESKISEFNKEKNKRKFEEIKSKTVKQISQNDIRFIAQNYYKTPEEIIDFIAKTYGMMPQFALPIILEMRTGDKKKIIPDIITKLNGKFVDEDDFYFMINTDNIRNIYPDTDPQQFRDAIIAKIAKERKPEDFDKALVYAYIMHNTGNMVDAIKAIGEDKLKLLDESEILLLLNLAFSKGDRNVVRLINSAGKLPNFKPKDKLILIKSLDDKGVENAYEKITSIFGDDFFKQLESDDVMNVIIHFNDNLFNKIFTSYGQELIDKLTPNEINAINKTEKGDRIKNFTSNTPEEKKADEPVQTPPQNDSKNNQIYSELIKANGKRDIEVIINKYGKTAIRQLSPAQVAKILKNTAQKKFLADTFGRDLVQKAIDDPAGGSQLKFALNKERLSSDNISEENGGGFELFPTLKNNDDDNIVNTKEFQVNLIYDIINGFENVINLKYQKSDQKVTDKFVDYSWNSYVEDFEFEYDFEGHIVPLKIWIDNNEPVFMRSDGSRFRMDWLNTDKGNQYKKAMLNKLKSL